MKISIAIISALLASVSVPAADAAIVFTHARFVDGDRSMQNLVEFPDIGSDIEITVSCAGHATAKGRLRDTRCSAPNDPELAFTMAVSRRFNATRLVPATVNGKAEQVDFQFIVIFRKSGEDESITIYPHNMKNADRLGMDYIGAQRYSVHPWPERCGDLHLDDLIMEVAIVNELGTARDFDVMAANFGLSGSCREGFASHLKSGRWIPASHQGQYVESVWANPRVFSKQPYKRQQ